MKPIRALLPWLVGLLIAGAIVCAIHSVARADVPPQAPRPTWNRVELRGFIQVKGDKWNWTGNAKECAIVPSPINGGPWEKPLCFGNAADWKRCEQWQGFPAVVQAVEVSRGVNVWYLVESMTIEGEHEP